MARLKALAARVLSPSDRRVMRQTFWMGAMSGVQMLGGLAQVAITARILGPEGFGALAVIMAAGTLVHGIAAIPGGDTVITFVTRAVTEGRSREAAAILRFTLVVSQGLSLAAYAAIVVLTFAAANLLGLSDLHAGAMLLYGLVGVLTATQSETMAVLRLADRVQLGAAVTLAATLTGLALMVVAWQTDGGLSAVVTAYAAAAAVTGAGLLAAASASASRAGVEGVLRGLSLRTPPDVLRFQYGTFGRTAIGTLSQNLDSILVAHFAGAAEAGLYRAARRIIDMTRRPFNLIRTGVQPEYSRHWYAGRGAELRRTLRRSSTLSLALALAGFGLLVLLHRPIIRIVLGEEFADAASPLLIMIPGALVASSGVVSSLNVATGHTWSVLVSAMVGVLASLAVIVWLVPQYGAVGAAWASTTYSLVSLLVLAPFIVSIVRQSYRL